VTIASKNLFVLTEAIVGVRIHRCPFKYHSNYDFSYSRAPILPKSTTMGRRIVRNFTAWDGVQRGNEDDDAPDGSLFHTCRNGRCGG
jgi:hypothetical protein